MERLDHPDTPLSGTEIYADTRAVTINIGPHHPATHGVLRLLVTLEGEGVREITLIDRLRGHRHREELRRTRAYWKVIPIVERMDYLS